jgi:hypothetical protein
MRHTTLAIAFVLCGWLSPAAHAGGSQDGKRNTSLRRVRTAHEMVTSHERELKPFKTSDGSEISATPTHEGSRVRIVRGEEEFNEYRLDQRGRTLSLMTAGKGTLRHYSRAGELKRGDGSALEVLIAKTGEGFAIRLHFDGPVGPTARRTQLVVGPRDGWGSGSPTLERDIHPGEDSANTFLSFQELDGRFGRQKLAAYVRIQHEDGGVEYINVDGKAGANIPIGD